MRPKVLAPAILLLCLWLCAPVLAQGHSVSLQWDASTDSGASYNIYRLSGACPVSGTTGFSKITTAPVAPTTYTDGTVAPGTYCYYATSVLNGAESVPSNLVSAVILPAAPTSLSVTGSD